MPAELRARTHRERITAGGAFVAIYWFDLGVAGFFVAVAAGFCVYTALLRSTVFGVRTPDAVLAASS